MPPKGWRKNAEGKFPAVQKDTEPVPIDELLFPKSVIAKLAKNITQSDDGNMILSKDSLTAVQRSATVFVSHLMYRARQVAEESSRKNVNSQDIILALELADLGGFVPEVKQKLTQFELNAKAKKKQKAKSKEAGDAPAAKKLKDNQHDAVAKSEGDVNVSGADEDEEEEEEEEEDDDEDEDGATEAPSVEGHGDGGEASEEGEEADDGDNEEVSQNPIAALGKDEQELKGDEEENEEARAEDDEDSEDED